MEHLAQLILAVLGTGGLSTVLTQIVAERRGRAKSATPPTLDETAARLDIARQLDVERTERASADRRAEAADRRANRAERDAEIWEAHAAAVREACLAHGTPLHLLPARPVLHH